MGAKAAQIGSGSQQGIQLTVRLMYTHLLPKLCEQFFKEPFLGACIIARPSRVVPLPVPQPPLASSLPRA